MTEVDPTCLDIVRGTLADIGYAEDMTLKSARNKARRIYQLTKDAPEGIEKGYAVISAALKYCEQGGMQELQVAVDEFISFQVDMSQGNRASKSYDPGQKPHTAPEPPDFDNEI